MLTLLRWQIFLTDDRRRRRSQSLSKSSVTGERSRSRVVVTAETCNIEYKLWTVSLRSNLVH